MFLSTTTSRNSLNITNSRAFTMLASAKKHTQCFFYPKISAKFAPLNCIVAYYI